MTIKQIIQKAIEGGYYENNKLVKIKLNHETKPSWVYFTDEEDWKSKMPISKLFLDLNFWQSLSRGLKWGGMANPSNGKVIPTWQYQWHMFIDHLAFGKDFESFFKQF